MGGRADRTPTRETDAAADWDSAGSGVAVVIAGCSLAVQMQVAVVAGSAALAEDASLAAPPAPLVHALEVPRDAVQ